MFKYAKQIWDSREVLYNLTLREIRGQYKRTLLGQFWSLLNPLAAMAIYTFIFAFLFRVPLSPGNPSGVNNYALWLLIGLLPWMFFARVMSTGVGILVVNAPLIQKVYYPRAILPFSMVGVVGFNWLFETGVLLVALLIAGSNFWIWLPLVALTMVLLGFFSAGIALLFSVANALFRDVEHALSVFTQIWFYLTPVIYPLALVEVQSEKIGPILGTPFTFLDIYSLNPMVSYVTVFRAFLYDNAMPPVSSIVGSLVWAVIVFGAGLMAFAKVEKRLAELL